MEMKTETKMRIMQATGIVLIIIGAIVGIGNIINTFATKDHSMLMSVAPIIIIMSGVVLIENAYYWDD